MDEKPLEYPTIAQLAELVEAQAKLISDLTELIGALQKLAGEKVVGFNGG